MAAMDLHSDLADPELKSYLLVEQARDHQAHDLALALAQSLVAFSQLGNPALLLSRRTVAVQSLMDRIQQFLVQDRLRQKLHGPRFHGLHRHWNISMTGNKDDGDLDACVSQLTLKVQTVNARKAYV